MWIDPRLKFHNETDQKSEVLLVLSMVRHISYNNFYEVKQKLILKFLRKIENSIENLSEKCNKFMLICRTGNFYRKFGLPTLLYSMVEIVICIK
jgi:hypothetical protein